MQRDSGWGQGYFMGATYPGYCFSEMSPGWLDFSCLLGSHNPWRRSLSTPFRFLELGSGLGVGLCLLAAAYPEGRFIGVDLHPAHIAYSQWLASELSLANISFHEADFLDMGACPPSLPFANSLRFDYIAAHGIISWIAPEIRSALFRATSALLRPGGIFYCSYNTFPGWLERSTFKALADLERRLVSEADVLSGFSRATNTIQRLMATSEAPSALGSALPRLAKQLEDISDTKSAGYLCGEFAHEHWQPFYVGDVHRLAADHRLTFAASASLPENHPNLLPPHLATVVQNESDPLIRQAVFDLAINQSFRRDIFVKGALPLSRTAQQQQLAAVRLRRVAPPPADRAEAVTIPTSLGTITDDSGRLQQMEALLADQPLTLGEIHQALAIPPDDLVVLTSLLLHSGRIGLDRGDAIPAAVDSCRVVNRRIVELMQGGHNLGFLAAPTVGHGAQPFSLLDAFVLDGLQQGLEDDVLCSCVWMAMEAAGVEMRGPDGALLTDPQDCLRRIGEHITIFRATTMPRLVQVGIVDPPL